MRDTIATSARLTQAERMGLAEPTDTNHTELTMEDDGTYTVTKAGQSTSITKGEALALVAGQFGLTAAEASVMVTRLVSRLAEDRPRPIDIF